ncbi:hypothetical protein [Nioella sp.]|uniref:hypothetical protein n=1 Tax=Nioella sp. TaxID=1912091 RepID=UPI003B51922C
MSRDKKLERLSQIAELKATLAKGEAARAGATTEGLAMKIRHLQSERRTMASEPPDPATARTHAAWLRHCDGALRDLRGEEARARTLLEGKLDRARYEEGRRQVLEKLKSQAS